MQYGHNRNMQVSFKACCDVVLKKKKSKHNSIHVFLSSADRGQGHDGFIARSLANI